MASLALGVRFGPVSAGTADFVYSGTVTGYTNPTGLTDGHTYRYRAESGDLSQWEWGSGAWTAGTSTLARTTVLLSSNSNAKVSFTAQPQVSIVIFPADVLLFDDAMSLTAAQQAQGRQNISAFLRGQIAGLTLSTSASSPTFGISAGEAADSTNVALMVLPSAFTKTTGAWASGTGNGALDTGSMTGSAWYHVHVIAGAGQPTDILISLSVASPTMPTNYTLSRRIGSMQIGSAGINWLQFVQLGDEFLWSVSVGDVNVTTLGTTATSFALTVPSGIKVWALLRVSISNAAVNTTALVTSLDQNAEASNSFPGNRTLLVNVASILIAANLTVRTNTAQQIRAVASAASTTLQIATYGWVDRRGKDA